MESENETRDAHDLRGRWQEWKTSEHNYPVWYAAPAEQDIKAIIFSIITFFNY